MTTEKHTLRTLAEAQKNALLDPHELSLANENPGGENIIDPLFVLKLCHLIDDGNGWAAPILTPLGRWVVENSFFSWVTDDYESVLSAVKNKYTLNHPAILGDAVDKGFLTVNFTEYPYVLTHKGRLLLALLTGDFGDLNLDPEVKCQSLK